MEAGEIQNASDFLDAEAASKPGPDVDLDESLLPTLLEVEAGLRGVKPHKATGLDQIPGDALRQLSRPLARLLLPIMLKSVVHVRQPVQWRGGTLFAAWKKSGSMHDPGSYRSLFVSSAVGKVYHRMMRNKAAITAETSFGSCHMGARAGSPVTHGSHIVLAHEQMCRRKGWSSAILFLDTRSAYYRVVRHAVTGLHGAEDLDECVCKILQHFSMPRDAWSRLLDIVQQGGAMGRAGVSPHLCAIVDDLQSEAYFVTQYASRQRLRRTRAGSRPGESLADIVFGFIYSEALRCVREAVVEEGLTDPVATDGELSLWEHSQDEHAWVTDATWADDSAFLSRGSSPEQVLRRAQLLATWVIDAVKSHALEPNMKPGKTSLLVSLRGTGRKKAARRWFGTKGAWMRLETKTAGEVDLAIVADYIHLGFHLDRGVSFRPEALRRLSQARSAFREAKDLVLQNPSIPRPDRARLFDALIDSTFFNLELWQQPDGPAWHKLKVGYSRLQRAILSREMHPEVLMKLSAADVSFILGTPSLQALVRSRRLRYLATLVKAGPAELWAVLKSEQAWMQCVLEDLQWFRNHAAGTWPEVTPAHWPLWWHEMKQHAGKYKRCDRGFAGNE